MKIAKPDKASVVMKPMRRTQVLLLAIVSVIMAYAPITAFSTPLIFFDEAIDGEVGTNGFYRFDTDTGEVSLIAPVTGDQRFFSLTRNPFDGTVFALDIFPSTRVPSVYTVDLRTGSINYEVQINLPSVGSGIADITFNPLTGEMFAIDRAFSLLYTVDLHSGDLSVIGDSGEGFLRPPRTALTFSPKGELFGFSADFQGDNGTLFGIDPLDASATLIGNGGPTPLVLQDATFSRGGKLFVSDFDGRIYRVDQQTGVRTVTGNTGLGSGLSGLIDWRPVIKVPEPGTLALLGIGLFGMGLARRKKKV